jgi:hypothetical protein
VTNYIAVPANVLAVALSAAIPDIATLRSSEPGKPDPIFALIDEYQHCLDEYHRLAEEMIDIGDPPDDCMDTHDSLEHEILEVLPETKAGALALMRCAATFAEAYLENRDNEVGEALVRASAFLMNTTSSEVISRIDSNNGCANAILAGRYAEEMAEREVERLAYLAHKKTREIA